MGFLQSQGHGTFLSSRFGNLMADSSGGPFEIVRTLLVDPGYMFSTVFQEEKMLYLLAMLLPVACIPLFGKRLSQLVLLLPFLLINLLPDYPYQHNLYFQYGFGAIALSSLSCGIPPTRSPGNPDSKAGHGDEPDRLFLYHTNRGWSCIPLIAAAMVSWIREKSATREFGLLTASSWLMGTK